MRATSLGHFRPGRLDWTYSAEIEPPPVGQFVYRLHVDPRLNIRAVTVEEDGAERLMRWSQLRETVVLFLNDMATRTQTVRIDASLPMSASQEIDLPRIRVAGTTPAPESITLYRDVDLVVRLANPEDFPLPPLIATSPSLASSAGSLSAISEREVNASRDLLVARLDFLPEQATPRMLVEPVVPQIAAETATILEHRAGVWQSTHCIRFHLVAGRTDTFKIELPESLAERVEVRSIPTSGIRAELPVDGRTILVLHPDEPVGDQFVVVLTSSVDMTAAAWPLTTVGLPGAEQTVTVLAVPGEGLESVDAALPVDSAAIPPWLKAVLPDLPPLPSWKTYRWPGSPPAIEFRATGENSSKAGVGWARFDLWLEPNGSILGWVGLQLSDSHPSRSSSSIGPRVRIPLHFMSPASFLRCPPRIGRLDDPNPTLHKRRARLAGMERHWPSATRLVGPSGRGGSLAAQCSC